MTSYSLVALLSLIISANAFITFDTNCTAPSTHVSFVSSAATRGTLDILWSCLFTIVACTWTVQHLNVPEQREGRDPGWKGNIKWALKSAWTSGKWMLLTTIAPELLLGKNWGDVQDARFNLVQLQAFAKTDGVPWTLTHSLFANMGGFVIRSHVPGRVSSTESETHSRSNSQQSNSQQSNSQQSNSQQSNSQQSNSPRTTQPLDSIEPNIELQQMDTSNKVCDTTRVSAASGLSTESTPHHANPFHLIDTDILALRYCGDLPKLPFITRGELMDKSQSDSLVRIIAIAQISWIVIQIIARASRHLAITQLEIGVAAFSICAIILYGINWEKPKGVLVPWTILSYENDIPANVLNTLGRGRRPNTSSIDQIAVIIKDWSKNFRPKWKGGKAVRGSRVPNHFTSSGILGNADRDSWGVALGSILFGAVHLAAVNFHFPTTEERICWIVASTYCTSLAALVILLRGLRDVLGDWWLFDGLTLILILLYIMARLFLLVELFRTLGFLPPSAFVATWASNIPHVG